MSLVTLSRRLSQRVEQLAFGPPVAFVYNPLRYARATHEQYLERYGAGPKKVLMLGMNPGPFGMAQTGVPFGEIEAARTFLGISGKVAKPKPEHPKRPITGFDCARSEVSGRRLWGWVEARFGTAKRFFRDHYVHNYCPLVFMEEGGRNVTPDKLAAAERRALYEVCDRHLREVVAALGVAWVVGIGAFAEKRARDVLAADTDLQFGRLPHPSPASPLANRGWETIADEAFEALAI